ncbi:hypothetical protein KHC23_18240 [Ancylobacter dichloromethanicus]|uniref:Uncharacterized protein n=2 Tax=Ancylobacter dichloromethanicus TaxID=518825 RepID=A0A9W6MYB8_9HYPH|nr:hypothetical protein [Ancylobacter dichloromethanicus]MBS7555578.1 hypothetical protein [Ancylobacter dichloromethanicus]GLK70780.1 hypothetical protein GCM10017643_08950 [Ancylobacter dichloromethanicus]
MMAEGIAMAASCGATVSSAPGAARPEARRRLPTTIGFAAVPDHVRMPARFFGRFTACAVAGLS